MTTATRTNNYTLIDYFDVWGNQSDGWEVNDQMPISRNMEIPEDAEDAEILSLLKNSGYLTTDDGAQVGIEEYGDGIIEIFEAERHFPLGRLVRTA